MLKMPQIEVCMCAGNCRTLKDAPRYMQQATSPTALLEYRAPQSTIRRSGPTEMFPSPQVAGFVVESASLFTKASA